MSINTVTPPRCGSLLNAAYSRDFAPSLITTHLRCSVESVISPGLCGMLIYRGVFGVFGVEDFCDFDQIACDSHSREAG